MQVPTDYRTDQRAGQIREGLYLIALADLNMVKLCDYAWMKGKRYSRMVNTRKAFFAPITEQMEHVHFRDFDAAKRALIEIGRTPVANVPVGSYNLIVYKTIDGEPILVLPYHVKKEVSNELLASEQRTYPAGHQTVQPEHPPLPAQDRRYRRLDYI